MAQYLIIPKRLARALPPLGRAAQALEAWLFRGLFRAVDCLSPERAAAVCAALFRFIGPRTAKARKAARNLAIAFPEQPAEWQRRTVREIFHHLGVSAAELIKLEQIWRERGQRLEFILEPGAQPLIEAKAPAVYVCAHVGPWQLVNLISLRYGLDISTIYAAESNPALQATMRQLREAFGVQLISSNAGARPLLQELNAGNSIGMAMDTRLDSGALIPFFNRDALTNTAAARLAQRTGAAILPVRAQRLPGTRFRITVLNPIPTQSADPETITRQINAHFESWIRETPGEWICLKRRWPKARKL